jgi:hypothetical protein
VEVPKLSLILGLRLFCNTFQEVSSNTHQVRYNPLLSFAKSLGYSKNLLTVEVYTIDHRH